MSEKKESKEERSEILSGVFGEEILNVSQEEIAQSQKDSAYIQLLMYRDLPQFEKLAQGFINYFDLSMKVEDIDTKNCDIPTIQEQEEMMEEDEFYSLLPTDDVQLTHKEQSELSVAEKRAKYFEATQEINQTNKPKFIH